MSKEKEKTVPEEEKAPAKLAIKAAQDNLRSAIAELEGLRWERYNMVISKVHGLIHFVSQALHEMVRAIEYATKDVVAKRKEEVKEEE